MLTDTAQSKLTFSLALAVLIACSGGESAPVGGDADDSVPAATPDAAAQDNDAQATYPAADALPAAPDVEAPAAGPRNPQHPLACERPLAQNPESTQLIRLTNQQYLNTLQVLFGTVVTAAELPKLEDFSAQPLVGRFSNNVAGQVDTEADAALREKTAVAVADAVAKNLARVMGCEAADTAAEGSCFDSFLGRFGRRAWRRPLRDKEREALKNLYTQARAQFDFADSVSAVVGAMLQSPQFLFRIHEGVGAGRPDGSKSLSAYEVAGNLSYLLWNSMPDEALFAAAEAGTLVTEDEVERQARRMLSDERAREPIAEFEREWLRLQHLRDQADAAAKTAGTFASYTQAQSTALAAGLQAFVADAFWAGDHSLKTLLTSSKGFVNDSSAALYGVKAPGAAALTAVTLNPTERRGVLTQPGVMAGLASPRGHSPSQRGAYVMERLLCAPPERDGSQPLPPEPVATATFRQVFELAVQPAGCARCHKSIDGIGFLFEHYDGIGMYRIDDGGLPVNAAGFLMGSSDANGNFNDALALADTLSNSEQVAECAVRNFYEFAVARSPLPEDGCVIEPVTDRFLQSGTNMHQLVIDVVTSPAFRFRSAAAP